MSLVDPGLSTVAEEIEAQCRRAMATRAGLPTDWRNRATKEAMMSDVNALLEQWNMVTLGR